MPHTLLIVDDEPDVLLCLRGLFRKRYDVLTATAPNAALDLLDTQEVHVVICDQRLPGMSGTDFLVEVNRRRPDVVAMMITGYTDITSVTDAINRGHVFRYITKPWEPKDLESAVRQAVEHYSLLADRRRLVRELEEANRMKTAFITTASHELNTPLTVLQGMLDLALMQSDEGPVANLLTRAKRSADRLQNVVADTFKLVQEQDFRRRIQVEPLDCLELIAATEQELAPYLKQRKQTIVAGVEPAGLKVTGSKMHLQDVLINLLTNAIKFSPDGAEIRVAADRQEAGVRFEIADQGMGIAWADQPRVFDPLFSSWDFRHHSSGEFGFGKRGMGLGLAIAKRFVEMHGGEIDFDSTPAQGTCFRFLIPDQARVSVMEPARP